MGQMSRDSFGGGASGGATGQSVPRGDLKPMGSVSYKGSEVGPMEKAAQRAQTRAASSYKSTDMEKTDAAKRAAETRKANEQSRLENAYKYGKQEGTIKGATAATVTAGVVAGFLHERNKPKGTQPDHHVTDSNNNIKTVKK